MWSLIKKDDKIIKKGLGPTRVSICHPLRTFSGDMKNADTCHHQQSADISYG